MPERHGPNGKTEEARPKAKKPPGYRKFSKLLKQVMAAKKLPAR